jgi:hypothetical protein
MSGTSSETTSSVTAKAKTASLNASTRVISPPRNLNGDTADEPDVAVRSVLPASGTLML